MFATLRRTAWRRCYSRPEKAERPREPLRNEAIQVPEIMFITADNVRQGPMAPSAILATLDRRRFDLVLVNPTHTPPLAKALPRINVYQRASQTATASTLQRLRQREKEVRFGTSMAPHDREIRLGKVRELLRRAYRVRLVVEARGRGAGGAMGRVAVMARETMYRELMETLKREFAKDLMVLTPPESLGGSLMTVIYSASATPPSTKPANHHRHAEGEDEDEDEDHGGTLT